MAVYLKAAVGALPGAGRLPFVAGGGGPMPDIELAEPEVRAERDRVADYAHVCGFRLRDRLPATYPHVLAFPLHMRLMTDGSFPFSPVGLVHVANRIEVRRPLRLGETLDLRVRPGRVEDHPKGRAFAIVTEARADGELAWREESTILRRGGGSGGSDGEPAAGDAAPSGPSAGDAAPSDAPAGDAPAGDAPVEDAPAEDAPAEDAPDLRFVAEWHLRGDLGRRYAAVSGDRNPIHMHRLTARLFGFPRPIAHGMWTKARCLAALEPTLPDAYEVDVEFRKPLLLPGRASFERAGDRFRVRGGEEVHLLGRIRE
jgi:acyl dehydratase